MRSPIKVTVSQQIVSYTSTLHPEHRRAIKAELKKLEEEAGQTKKLNGSLAGFERLRIGKFRLIFKRLKSGSIECVYIEERKRVYQEFSALADSPLSP